jgi:hypothetical protein
MVLPTPASRYRASATFVSSPDPYDASDLLSISADGPASFIRPAEKTPSGWTLPRIIAASMRERALHALLDSQCGSVGFPCVGEACEGYAGGRCDSKWLIGVFWGGRRVLEIGQ